MGTGTSGNCCLEVMMFGRRLALLLFQLCTSAALVCVCLIKASGNSGNSEGGCSCLPAAGSEKPLVSAHFPPSHRSGAFTPRRRRCSPLLTVLEGADLC